jgi:predicted 3-demethylubiquinone-9 3-methyltransferase (glyoxalase superfamily)
MLIDGDRKGSVAWEINRMSKITPCLGFDGKAEEAARLYVSILPDSRIDAIVKSAVDTPGAKAGSVLLVEFTLAGQSYLALNGGPAFQFNEAISFSVNCVDQAEVDRVWDTLLADGGKPIQCGWLKDKFGVAWQVVPEALPRLMKDKDPAKVARVTQAMMKMIKLDIAALERAFTGA